MNKKATENLIIKTSNFSLKKNHYNDFTNSSEGKQAWLAAIVNSSDDAIISKTLQGIITSWNKAATKMFGYTEQEALGKHITLIIPEDRLDEETVIIENIRSGKSFNK